MTQRGQAMVEGIVLFPVLVAVLVMAHWLLYAQHEKSRLQLAAAHGAFLRTKLWSADLALTPQQRNALQRAEAKGMQYSSESYDWEMGLRNETWVLAAEVHLEDSGLHQSRIQKTLDHALFPSLSLQQQHVVLVGSGDATDATAVRQRLEKAPQWWATAAQRSQTHVQRMASLVSDVDSAWKREGPERNWLQRWEHSIPMRYEQQE
ncbi:MAG: hypothetical protein ACTJHW_09050 [Paenalcaligenes sp.]